MLCLQTAPSYQRKLAYRDEVVLRKAARLNVVLQELLGEVLVHLCCLMRIHGVPTGLVQVWKTGAVCVYLETPVSNWPPLVGGDSFLSLMIESSSSQIR